MKKYILLLTALCGLYSCQQDLDTYSGVDFAYFDATVDTTFASFAYIDTEQEVDTVQLWVRFSGQVTGYDRKVKLIVTESNGTVGTDYRELPEYYTLPANSTVCIATVELLRSEILKKEERYLVVELRENEHFKLMYPESDGKNSEQKYSKIQHRISFSEIMTPPKKWTVPYFGDFSVKKLATMCEEMKISRDKFNDVNYMVLSRQKYIAKKMKQILEDYAKNGKTIYEDDDVTEMKMGKSA